MACPVKITKEVIEKSNLGVRAMQDLAAFLTADIKEPTDRITILLSCAIQGIYNIAIELEEAGECDESNSAGMAMKYFLDAFANVEPTVIKTEQSFRAPNKEPIH